jgi:hypothetical protein
MPVPTIPTNEKKEWVRSYLSDPDNLWKSFAEIREACKAQFGEVLGTTALNQIIAEMRHGKTGSELNLPTSVAEIRAAMEKLGIEAIRINNDGKTEVVMKDA